MDEKGFMLGRSVKVKVIVRRGRKNPRYTQGGKPEMVTMIECISADGCVLPPIFIYKGTKHLLGWYADVKKDLDAGKATFAWSTKGWTNNELGLEWLERNFDRYSGDM